MKKMYSLKRKTIIMEEGKDAATMELAHWWILPWQQIEIYNVQKIFFKYSKENMFFVKMQNVWREKTIMMEQRKGAATVKVTYCWTHLWQEIETYNMEKIKENSIKKFFPLRSDFSSETQANIYPHQTTFGIFQH